jgi:hypothetical protein
MRDRCIIITGTIVPNVLIHGHEGIGTTLRQSEYEDVATRRDRYLETLWSYSTVGPAPIFFLENSAFEFKTDDAFRELFRRTGITLVKFATSQHISCGKGFQEFSMLDEAVNGLADRFRSFVKVSGRYEYRNMSLLMKTETDGIAIDLLRRKRVAITSVFVSTVEFYQEHLVGLYREADDSRGEWIEKRLYARLRRPVCRQKVELLPVEPELRDWTRPKETKYNASRRWLKGALRDSERTILRRLRVNELYL